jgi:hypothetical protein
MLGGATQRNHEAESQNHDDGSLYGAVRNRMGEMAGQDGATGNVISSGGG